MSAMQFHHGKGANGKSTFMAVQQMLLGAHQAAVGVEALLVPCHNEKSIKANSEGDETEATKLREGGAS